jgi:Ca-activated chloride channel homolog
VKTITSLVTASALAFLAAAEGASVTLSVKPEREYLLAGGPRDTVVLVELRAKEADAKRTAPINLALVLDHSGSMRGAKLEKARQAAGVALDQLGPDDIFSLVIYDDQVEVLIPPQRVKDREDMKRKIAHIREGGCTALYAGVEKGANQLRKYFDKEKVNRIVLLSDGLANVGPSSTSALAKLGKELRGEGFGVSTVGLGDDYNEDLMTALAEASRANYYYVKDAEKLPGIFKDELGTVKNAVARNVKVTITLPDGVKPKCVLGEDDLAFRGQTVTIPLAELFGSQTRRFLIACDAPASDVREIALANVELSYEDSETGNASAENRTAKIAQTSDSSLVEKSIQPDVASSVAITRNRLTKAEAVKLADAGKSRDAAALLVRQAAANAALPVAAQSDLLKKDDQELKQKAEELQSSGSLSKGSRKEIQYHNYQDKNQKR